MQLPWIQLSGEFFTVSYLRSLALACKKAQRSAHLPIVAVNFRPGRWEPIRTNHARKFWRRRRDSNPRYAFGAYNGLANRRLQPLGHVSVCEKAYRIPPAWSNSRFVPLRSG